MGRQPPWEGFRLAPEDELRMAARLFRESPTWSRPLSDDALGGALRFAVEQGQAGALDSLHDESVSLSLRAACVTEMLALYRDVLAPRLADLRDPDVARRHPPVLASVCTMWWEYVPLGPSPDSTAGVAMDHCVIGVLSLTLALPSVACQWSAVHGLGHWIPGYPEVVGPVLRHFIASSAGASPCLCAYAKLAAAGKIL